MTKDRTVFPSPGRIAQAQCHASAFLARIVEEGLIPAVHGVVRWRACDLIMRLHEVYRALKDLGFSHVSARPMLSKKGSTEATNTEFLLIEISKSFEMMGRQERDQGQASNRLKATPGPPLFCRWVDLLSVSCFRRTLSPDA